MLNVAMIVLFLLVFYQDIKYKAVHWILFPLLLLISMLIGWETHTIHSWLFNLGFVVFILGALTFYLTIKKRRLVNITDGFFSLGDILFLLAIIPLFDFQSYMVFFTLGTFFTLLLHLSVHLFKPQTVIPYAGYMSLIGISYVLIGSSYFSVFQL